MLNKMNFPFPSWYYRVALRVALLKFLEKFPDSSISDILDYLKIDYESPTKSEIVEEIKSMAYHGLIKSSWNESISCLEYYIDWNKKFFFDLTAGIPERSGFCNVSYDYITQISLEDFMQKFHQLQF